MKNQLQGAATNIIANNSSHLAPGQMVMSPGEGQVQQQQYDDLKKKLLTEYKKMQKVKGSSHSGHPAKDRERDRGDTQQSPGQGPTISNLMVMQKQSSSSQQVQSNTNSQAQIQTYLSQKNQQ